MNARAASLQWHAQKDPTEPGMWRLVRYSAVDSEGALLGQMVAKSPSGKTRRFSTSDAARSAAEALNDPTLGFGAD